LLDPIQLFGMPKLVDLNIFTGVLFIY